MADRIPVLVYYPKNIIKLMDQIKTEKYVSRSEMIRIAMRSLLGQTESQALKEVRAMRAEADNYYLKRAGGDYRKAAELEGEDLKEFRKKYWSQKAKESESRAYNRKIESPAA
jgi:Arc/MetJ-type ribon-helix-helix transcriptional regulator